MNDMSPLFRQYVDDAYSCSESCRGGRCGSMLYSIKAIARRARPVVESAAERSIERAEIFLKDGSRKTMAGDSISGKGLALVKIIEK